MNTLSNFRLRNAPVSWKVLVVGYLLSLALGYCYALANVALVIGFSRDQIAVHYYGAKEKIQKSSVPKVSGGEQSLDLDADTSVAEPPAVSQPSLKKIVGEGHFHLLGMTSFFFGLTILGLFTNYREKFKALLVGIPYVLIIIDNLSFVITRVFGPGFASLTAVAGGMMALSFGFLWFSVLLELIQPTNGG